MRIDWGRVLTLTAAAMAGAALVLEFQAHSERIASEKAANIADIKQETAFLLEFYSNSTVEGPFQTLESGCGRSNSRYGGRNIPQRIYVVKKPERKFPVGVCRDRSLPMGYRVFDDLPLRY
jgi:hypothetical protein